MAKSKILAYTTRVGLLKHMINMHYVEVSAAMVQTLGGKLPIRVLCTINGVLTFQGGLVSLGHGMGYITINKQRMIELGLRLGDQIDVSLQPDTSKYGLPVPEEFEELLKQDDEGRRRFALLTPGKQRTIIHYISTVKSSHLRIDRAILFIINLKAQPEGKEELSKIFKRS